MNKNEMKRQRLVERNEQIQKEFLDWKEKKEDGKQIYTDEYIFNKLAKKYFLASKTIENIVFHRVKYQE